MQNLAYAQGYEIPMRTPTQASGGAAVEKPFGDRPPLDEPITGAALIKVGQAQLRRSLMAMPGFKYLGNVAVNPHRNIGVELFDTISSDLELSEYFTFINPRAFLEDPDKTNLKPYIGPMSTPAPGTPESLTDSKASNPGGFKFDSWKKISADFLIRGGYLVSGKDLSLEVYVYNVSRGDLVFGKVYKGTLAQAKYMGHIFANDVLLNITGKKGWFTTRIVASSDRGSQPAKEGSEGSVQKKEIVVMDWDGTNMQPITDNKSLSISPAWSPDAKSIVYSTFAMHAKSKERNIDLFRYDFPTKKTFMISYLKGINSGAAFFPTGDKLVATISKGSSPDLHELDRDGKILRRITAGPAGAMNVEPAVSPDGQKIAFSSDRAGNPMIYVMNASGDGVERMTFAGKFNASPAWAPDGKTIAFAGWDRDHFDIFTVSIDKKHLRRLTSATKPNGRAATNEDPHFSPDGRRIVFTSNRTGTNQIYIVNLDGSDERQITKDKHNYYKPKWSPFLD